MILTFASFYSKNLNKVKYDLLYKKALNIRDFKNEISNIVITDPVKFLNLSKFDWINYFRNRGCKVVPYKCGNEYIISMENIIFNTRNSKPNYTQVDQVWNIPQMENTNQERF
mgnify:CR=1 FL=1